MEKRDISRRGGGLLLPFVYVSIPRELNFVVVVVVVVVVVSSSPIFHGFGLGPKQN